jgi:hypothetical protein
VGKPDGKRPLRRPSSRLKDNIKIDFRETEWGGTGWICLAQDRDQWRALVNTVMGLRVGYSVGKFFNSWEPGGFSRTQLHGVTSLVS